MIKPINIQYPVGQGGLHLGIIGKTAYIYDCGCRCSRKKLGFYNTFLIDMCNLLKKHSIRRLYIYLSHLDNDHYNLLPEFLDILKLYWYGQLTFYIPKINEPEKIYFLSKFSGTRIEYKTFYDFIKSPTDYLEGYYRDGSDNSGDNGVNIRVHELEPTQDNDNEDRQYKEHNERRGIITINDIVGLDWILDPFIDGHTGIKTNITIDRVDTLDKIKKYKKQLNLKDTHLSMLCLYCGPIESQSNFRLLRYSYYHPLCYPEMLKPGWLHTGDKDLKDIIHTKFYSHYKWYEKNVGIMQVPHHASKYNHDQNFNNMFSDTTNMVFYFTLSMSGGNAKPYVRDIIRYNLLPMSEYSNPLIVYSL